MMKEQFNILGKYCDPVTISGYHEVVVPVEMHVFHISSIVMLAT